MWMGIVSYAGLDDAILVYNILQRLYASSLSYRLYVYCHVVHHMMAVRGVCVVLCCEGNVGIRLTLNMYVIGNGYWLSTLR